MAPPSRPARYISGREAFVIGLMLTAAAWAGKWDAAEPDVVVTQVVHAAPEVIHARLADWRGLAVVFPSSCVSEWTFEGATAGVGARAEALYTFGPMRRRLWGAIRKDDPGVLLETELDGKKGWFTQVTYAPADAGTAVTLRSPVARPKWPLTGVFFTEVKPAWEECYRQTLTALDAAVQGSAAP